MEKPTITTQVEISAHLWQQAKETAAKQMRNITRLVDYALVQVVHELEELKASGAIVQPIARQPDQPVKRLGIQLNRANYMQVKTLVENLGLSLTAVFTLILDRYVKTGEVKGKYFKSQKIIADSTDNQKETQ